MESESGTTGAILTKWNEIKEIMQEIELDVVKNDRGVIAAGLRVRKGLRVIKARTAALVKLTIELGKVKKDKKEKAPKTPKATKAAKTE